MVQFKCKYFINILNIPPPPLHFCGAILFECNRVVSQSESLFHEILLGKVTSRKSWTSHCRNITVSASTLVCRNSSEVFGIIIALSDGGKRPTPEHLADLKRNLWIKKKTRTKLSSNVFIAWEVHHLKTAGRPEGAPKNLYLLLMEWRQNRSFKQTQNCPHGKKPKCPLFCLFFPLQPKVTKEKPKGCKKHRRLSSCRDHGGLEQPECCSVAKETMWKRRKSRGFLLTFRVSLTAVESTP